MTKGKDLIPGEHNAKTWFNIMAIKNPYLWLAIVGLFLFILQIVNYEWCIELIFTQPKEGFMLTILGMLIPVSVFLLCSILGLYRFWKYLKGDI